MTTPFPHDQYLVRIGSDKLLTHEYLIRQFDTDAGLDSAEQIGIRRFFDENPLDKIRFVAVSLQRKVR